MRFLFLLLAFWLPQCLAALPQVSQGTLVRHSDLASHDLAPRHLDVWLPPGFDTEKSYDLLLMHDGQMLFDASTTWNGQEWRVDEVAAALQQKGLTRPFIVVGIHNGGGQRHNEYFPQAPFEALPKPLQEIYLALERSPGRALFGGPVNSDAYLAFLVETVLPYIEARYPSTGQRYLLGSSMGGLISWYGLAQYPNIFDGAACLSTHWPGVMTADSPVPEAFRQHLEKKLPLLHQHRLYFDHGDQTLDALYPPLQADVDEVLEASALPRSQWTSRFFPGAKHDEQAWADRLAQPLMFLMGNE